MLSLTHFNAAMESHNLGQSHLWIGDSSSQKDMAKIGQKEVVHNKFEPVLCLKNIDGADQKHKYGEGTSSQEFSPDRHLASTFMGNFHLDSSSGLEPNF